jgi:hypothetical protein
MKKFVYVGPTITGVATRNTVYEGMPETLNKAIQDRPYMAGLCIPVSGLGNALSQISRGQGGVYTLYNKALSESAEIQKGAN